MNLHDLFAIPRQRTPDKPALESTAWDGSPIQFTYDQLFDAADRLAAGLQAWGVQKGDRVAFYLANRPEFVIAYLAVIRLGAIMVPINLRYRRLEIGHILRDSEPRLLISERSQLVILDEVDEAAKRSLADVLLVEELDAWLGDADDLVPPPVAGDDLALIMYTSGTTGRSKGAMLSHNNVLATVTGLLSAWAWEPDDALLLTLPLFHTHGLVVGLHCALAAGATTLLRPKFETEPVLADLRSGQLTLFFGVPTLYIRLLDAMERLSPEERDFSAMRLFCSGSAPLAAETHRAFARLTGHQILERYGMTETGMNLSNPYAGPRVPGSVGTPLPGVAMRIVDPTDFTDIAPGGEGLLLVQGSHVFAAYWRAPEKTAESFVHDELGRRWFITGDLARQDPASGYVTLLGRSHELIISGGFNIYPREIEELLERYEGVAEAAVVGRPHEQWGEVPVAYLVCEEGVAEIDEVGLRAYCRARLASFKAPHRFLQVERLPRNAMGKVQKHLLEGGDD